MRTLCYCLCLNTGQTERAAEDCAGGECLATKTAHQVRTAVSQVYDENLTYYSD